MRRLLVRRVSVYAAAGLASSVVVAVVAAIWSDPFDDQDPTIELVRGDPGVTYVVTARSWGSTVVLRAGVRSVYPTPLRPDATRSEVAAWTRQLGHDQIVAETSAPRWARSLPAWAAPSEASEHMALAAGWPCGGSCSPERSARGASSAGRGDAVRLAGTIFEAVAGNAAPSAVRGRRRWLVAGDPTHYRPSHAANTHWDNWPEGGRL